MLQCSWRETLRLGERSSAASGENEHGYATVSLRRLAAAPLFVLVSLVHGMNWSGCDSIRCQSERQAQSRGDFNSYVVSGGARQAKLNSWFRDYRA
jgi:hypothetical protein